MPSPINYWLTNIAATQTFDHSWDRKSLPTGEKVWRRRMVMEEGAAGKQLRISHSLPSGKSAYSLNIATGVLNYEGPSAKGGKEVCLPAQSGCYAPHLKAMEESITCTSATCKNLRYYLAGLRSVAQPGVVGPSAAAVPAKAPSSCPPSLEKEGTVSISSLTPPSGREISLMGFDAAFSFNIQGNPDNEQKPLVWPRCYRGDESVLLRPARTRSSPPAVSGVGYHYMAVYRNVEDATHVIVDVMPRTRGFIILEIYEADDRRMCIEPSKVPENRWLPRKDVDLFKVRIPVTPSTRWQRLVVPLSAFIDWNRKRPGCATDLKGINEDIGDGMLNPLKGESFQFQVVLEAEKPGAYASAYIGKRVHIVKRGAQGAIGTIAQAPKSAVPALVKCLSDKDSNVKREAADALGEIGSAAISAVPALVASLGDENSYVRSAAADALGKIGPAATSAVPALVKRLGNENSNIRSAAADALGKIGPAAKSAVPALVELLGDSDHDIRWRAVNILAKIGDVAVTELIARLGDNDKDVRLRVVYALGGIGPAAALAVPALIQRLDDSSAEVGWAAAYALGQIGPAAMAAVPALIRLLDDSDVHVRWKFADALGGIGPAAAIAVPALTRHLDDNDADVRKAVAKALRLITSESWARR